jgi:hypothetical protein
MGRTPLDATPSCTMYAPAVAMIVHFVCSAPASPAVVS